MPASQQAVEGKELSHIEQAAIWFAVAAVAMIGSLYAKGSYRFLVAVMAVVVALSVAFQFTLI